MEFVFKDEWLDPQPTAPENPEPVRPTTNMALAAVRGQQPGNLTTARRMAQELGIAPELALDLPQESLEELRARQIAANPGLADWAAKSTQNAAHARDNASFLSSFADAFTSLGADALHNITFHGPEIAANAGRSLVAGAADFNYALANTARAAAENLFGPDSIAARYLQSASQWADSSRKRYAPKADSTAGQFGYDFLRVAPQMAGTVMASLTNPVAATSLMGSQILGSSYGQMRDKGVSPARALASAATNTAIALPMERLGFDKLIAAIRTTGASAAVRQWLGAAVTEGTTEALQKAPDYVTQLWAEAELHGNTFDDRAQWFAGQLTDADNLMRATEEALYEGLIGAAWGGAFGSVGAVRSLRAGFPQEGGQADMPEELERLMADTSQESRAMAERQALGNALYQAAHSLDGAPASNDPDALQQMADASLPEAFRQTWIGPDDALALYQQAIQADPAQADALLYSLDQTPESLMQAVEQGAPLPVQTAAVLAQLSGDQRDQTLDALRPTPDGASGTEAAQWDPALRIGAAMRAGMDDMENVPPSVDEAKSAQKTRAGVNREITRITHEIEATGLYTRQAAETYALLAQQRALSAQAAYGVDPVAMLRRINIARGQDGEDGGLAQAAMYRAADTDITSFAERVFQEGTGAKPSYYSLAIEGMPDVDFRLMSDMVRHQQKRHPDMTPHDNEKIPAIMAGISLNNTYATGERGSFGLRHKGMQTMGGETYGYVFDIAPNGTVSLVTFFKDTPEKLKNWFEKKRKKASTAPVDYADASAQDPSFLDGKPFENSLQHFVNAARQDDIERPDEPVNATEIAPSLYAEQSQQGGDRQAESAINGISLSVLKGDVKPSRIADNVLLQTADQQQEQAQPLGMVTLSADNAAVRVFGRPGSGQSANLSTIPHEFGHVFLDDLQRISEDDGSIALNNLRGQLGLLLRGAQPDLRDNINAMLDSAQDIPTLRTVAATLRQQAQDARETVRINEQVVRELQQKAQEEGKQYQPGEERPWKDPLTEARLSQADASNYSRAERLVRNAIRHLQGLEQARADIRTLRQWAQVPEDGPLARGSEDYVKLHEAVARGFEQYLREGKAPSRKLEAVFGRMRDWLMKIYQHARDVLGLPITDDVRLVFDRMLATDKEIRQNKGMRRILDAENDFMGSGQLYHDEWEELNALRSEAEREVQAAMDRATLRDRNKRYKAYYLEAMDALGGSPFWQMVENLSARRRDQITGQSRGGINKSSLLHYLGKDQTADLARKRPGIVNAGDLGLDLDIIGLEEGYDDADALAHELYDAIVVRDESRQKLAKAHAEQRLADEDRMYEDEAMAWGSEAYAAYLDKVDEVALRMAARKGYKTQEEQDRFVRNAITPRQRIKNQAAMELSHTALRDISTARYQAMLDKALRDRSQALVDGNLMAVINAVDKARLANELIWQSRERLRTADATLKLAGETGSAKAGTFPTVHAAALSKLLNQYSLAHMRAATDPVLAHSSLRELVQQTLPPDDAGEGILPSFPDWLLNSQDPKTMQALPQGRQSWRDLTPSQLQEVENLLRHLRKKGYDERRDLRHSEAARIQTMVDKAVAAMQPLPDIQQAPADTLRRKAQDAMRSLYAATDSLRWQMRKADGFTNVQGEGTKGVMEEAVLDKAIEGEQRCRQRIDDISEAMAPHLAHLAKTVKSWEEQYGKNLMLRDSQGNLVETPPSFDDAYKRKTWTPDMVLSLALNCGNTSNMARIVSGYPDLSYDTLAELLGDHVATRIANAARGLEGQPPISQRGQRPGLLTAADWQAIQGIWNALATQWADTQAVHERMFGFKPQGVQAMPMSFADARGTVVHLDGGYYPVRYDPNISQRVANWSEQEDILSRNESQFAVPAAKRGHTQARAERAPGLPLRLDTSIIMEHINDTVRLIELGELVRQADRVTQAPAFREAYIRAYGKADYDAIRPNLRALVRQEPPPRGDWIVNAANVMRKYLVPWGLAWNLKVAALQLTALFPAMGDVGAGQVLRGMAHMARHPLAMRQIWDASPYMRSRLDNIDQDLQRNMAQFDPAKRPRIISIGKREFTWDDLVNAGMMPIVCMDAVATSAIWMGAYNKQLAALQGKSTNYGIDTDSKHHAEAVAFADSIIKQSNPDYDPSSRSGFLRAQNAYRLVNGFASAVTLFASRHKYMYTARAKGKISRARLARFEMFDTLVPAAAMFLMLAMARGYMGDDADDSEEKLMKLGMATLADSVSMRLPIFGSAIGDGVLALMNMNEGGYKAGGLRTTLDEPVRQFAGMTDRVGKAIWEGVENEEQARALVYGAADVASFISRIPVSKVVRNADRGLEQWERGEGTAFSILMPRPGK